MLTEFRSHARNIGSKILMALLVLTFGIWGIEDILGKTGSHSVVAEVGDIKISTADYQRSLYNETERLKQSLGNQFSPELMKNMGLGSYVIQQMINNNLLVLEGRKIGLRVSDGDVVAAIHKNPAFFNKNGKFDKQVFEKMLNSSSISEKSYIQKLRNDMVVDILVSGITSTISTPKNLPETLLASRLEKRNVELYSIPESLIKNVAVPSEEQLKEYYDTHIAEFTVPEYRTLNYVEITDEDAKKSVHNSGNSDKDKRIEEAYNDRIAEFKKPERRKIEQLLFASEEEAKKAREDIKSGKTFEQIGKDSKILNSKTIILGLVEKNNIPEEAAETVFSLSKGAVSEPIKTPFGWHIFNVQEIVPPSTLSLGEVRQQLEKDIEAQANENILTDFTNKLEDAIAGGSNLNEVAKEFNLKIVTLPALNKQGLGTDGKSEQKLPEVEKFLDTAFKTDEKSESPIISAKNGNNYIIRVENINHEHSQPFSDVKAKVTAGWILQEKQKQLAEIAQKISVGFRTKENREKTIKEYSLSVSDVFTVSQKRDDSQKLPSYITKEVFSTPVGSATDAFEKQNADGYAVVVVKEIISVSQNANDAKYLTDIANIGVEYNNNAQNEIMEQYLKDLAVKYSVSINGEALAQMETKER